MDARWYDLMRRRALKEHSLEALVAGITSTNEARVLQTSVIIEHQIFPSDT